MYYNKSSSSIGKVLVLVGLFFFRGSQESSLEMMKGLMTCFLIMQMCILVPSIVLPVRERSLTTYFVGETVVMLACGFVGLSILPRQYINMYEIFLLVHISSCQFDGLICSSWLLKCTFYVHTLMFVGTISICGSMIVYCPIEFAPEIAVALFCGELVGIVASVMCNVISLVSVSYENFMSKMWGL